MYRRTVAVVLLCFFLTAVARQSCQAANPSLGSIAPYGAQRGTEVEVHLHGDRLDDAQEVFVYYPGIEVKSFEVVGPNEIKTVMAIAPNCRAGIHAMRVRSATGISNLRTFMVGSLPEVAEVEPNSDFAAPQAIEPDHTVTGVITNEDVDYFVIAAKQGQRITAEVEGIRLGNTFFDPYVAIMNEGRFELSASDDAALVWQDGVASFVTPDDGNYIIQLRESSFGGSDACTYRLHVGSFPRPTAVYPTGGRPGETLEVRWLGDVAGEWTEQVTLPTEPSDRPEWFAHDDQGIAPSGNAIRVNDLANVLEAEPNNAREKATPFAGAAALNGVIAEPGDVDYFKFAATKGQVYDVRVHARNLRTPLDPVLSIERIGGVGVGGNDDSGGPDSYLRFTAPDDDEYVVLIQDHLKQGGSDYVYRVELMSVIPNLTMGLPERSQFVDTTVSVPRGNRTAFLVSASRADFGGDINVTMPDLPEGVTMETATMPGNQTVVPVLLTAPVEAPLAGRLVDVVGRLADENQDIEGRLKQTTSLVRGQNDIHVWDHNTNRMALAVTDEAPFSIEIVQPKVPLVRNGGMDLKVVATRKEGFTAPIAIRMLYNPPGVGASGSISIAEGATEAVIPLNANGSAEIRSWKIAVTGEATVGNGAVLLSSQLADLNVADQYFNLTYQVAAVEQGAETDVVITVANVTPYTEAAEVELLGLPNEVSTEKLTLAADATELVFHVKTTANSPVGQHKTLLCRAVVTQDGEPITHMLGTGQLQIDAPLPPKSSAAAEPAPMPVAIPEPPAAPEKRLTRLEKLRLDRQQAKEAKAAAVQNATPAPAADDTAAATTDGKTAENSEPAAPEKAES